MRTIIKAFLPVLVILITSWVYYFHSKIVITVTPSDASIFVDNVFKAKGYYEVEISDPKKPVMIRVEKPGYLTKSITYFYKADKKDIGFTSYERGRNTFRISLEISNGVKETTNFNSEGKDEASDFSKLETLKQDALISAAEATVLKDKLLENNDTNTKNTINELIKLRKILNVSFINKDQFNSIKGRILIGQYDFNKSASEALSKLKLKSESGEYSKEDIAVLKNNLLLEYK